MSGAAGLHATAMIYGESGVLILGPSGSGKSALALALLKPAPELPQGTLVVVLAGEDAKPKLLASSDRSSRYLTIAAIAPIALESDRALELWMLPDHGNPRSLGLVSAVAPMWSFRD